VETSDEIDSSENSCDNSEHNVFAIRNDGVSSEEQQNDQQTSQIYFNVSFLF